MDTQKHKLAHTIKIEVWQSDYQTEAEDQSHSNDNRYICEECGQPADVGNEISLKEFEIIERCKSCRDNLVTKPTN